MDDMGGVRLVILTPYTGQENLPQSNLKYDSSDPRAAPVIHSKYVSVFSTNLPLNNISEV